jgi:hypothetical protein
VKLTLADGVTVVYGGLAIGDVLVAEANRVHGLRLRRLTQDLWTDHWAFLLNN